MIQYFTTSDKWCEYDYFKSPKALEFFLLTYMTFYTHVFHLCSSNAFSKFCFCADLQPAITLTVNWNFSVPLFSAQFLTPPVLVDASRFRILRTDCVRYNEQVGMCQQSTNTCLTSLWGFSKAGPLRRKFISSLA